MRLRVLLAVGVAAAAIVGGTTSPAQANTGHAGTRYVALGDSYASGVGSAGPYLDATCRRSQTGYPPLVATAVAATSFSFEACSGALTADVISGQLGTLTRSTTLVTITAGGNDLGFSTGIGVCAQGTDVDCQAVVTAAQEFATTTLPGRLDDLYRQVKARALRAAIVVSGYPEFFELGTDCTGEPFSLAKRTALNSAVDTLDRTIARRAAAAGARYVDVRRVFAGHRVCAVDSWINGITTATPFHPTSTGYQDGYTPAIRAAIRR